MCGSAAACCLARIFTGALATLTVVVSLVLVPVAGQAQTAAADTWATPRTPWGHPDLQGVWDYRTTTPLERPEDQGTTAVLTDEVRPCRRTHGPHRRPIQRTASASHP